ncbi:MAG TPA: hypothetical protein VEB22_06615 [Phycisphaerales bacterium]|nr:hypothetical protein [Phycisphaerales bacterium]
MGWGRMLLLGNFGQQMNIDDVRQELAGLRTQIKEARASDQRHDVDQQQSEQIRALQRENEMLELCVATLARLLRAKGVVTAEEFDTLAELIDAPK